METMNNETETHGGSTVETTTNEEQHKGWRMVLERVGSWLSYKDKNIWLEQMRGNLGLIATVIATITFQMALNPPGGVRSIGDGANQPGSNTANANPPNAYAYPPGAYAYPPRDNQGSSDLYGPLRDNQGSSDLDGHLDGLSCDLSGHEILKLCPGESILAVIYEDLYFRFLVSNTVCFIASLCILLLLVSGIPLHHRLHMWMLSIGMWVTLTALAVSYITAVQMTTPDPIFETADKFLLRLVIAWLILLGIIALFHTLRIVIWVVTFFLKTSKNKSTRSYSNITRQRVN